MIATPAFGTGWLDYIDWMFFHLPLSGPVQASTVMIQNAVRSEVIERHHAKMRAEHRADGARDELRRSWKAYVKEHIMAKRDPATDCT